MGKQKVATKPRHVVIDLDGTLLFYDGWKGEYKLGKPIPGALDAVLWLLREGHKVTILTARTNHDLVRKHLARYGFPDLPITNVKPADGDVFIDDRAVRFTGEKWLSEMWRTFIVSSEPWWKGEKLPQGTIHDLTPERIRTPERVGAETD